MSCAFEINFGVRHGSMLSPFLFAVYLDDRSKLFFINNCAIVLYADDIMLLSSSVTYLERMLHACERETCLAGHVYQFK